DRHGRAVLENAQHIEKEHGPPEVHDEENGRNDRPCSGDPKCGAHQIELAGEYPGAGDERRHASRAADKKVERYFPGPDRRFHDRFAVVADGERDWSTRYIDAAAGDTVLRLLPHGVETIFEIPGAFVRHPRTMRRPGRPSQWRRWRWLTQPTMKISGEWSGSAVSAEGHRLPARPGGGKTRGFHRRTFPSDHTVAHRRSRSLARPEPAAHRVREGRPDGRRQWIQLGRLSRRPV